MRWPGVREPKLARAWLSLPFSQYPRVLWARLSPACGTPRGPPAFDWHRSSEELLCHADERRSVHRHRPSGPEGPSEGGCLVGPEGSASRPGGCPKAAPAALRWAPKCLRWRCPAPKGAPATGQTAVSCPRGSNGAAEPKSDAHCRSGGFRAEARPLAPKCLGCCTAEAGCVSAPKRAESPFWPAPKRQCRGPKLAAAL